MRCHRYVFAELEAALDTDYQRGVRLFDQALFGHIGLVFSNFCRSLWLGLTNALLVHAPVSTKEVRHYYQWLTRFSSGFALVADCLMLVLGSELKRRERLSARLGDILSMLYMISAVLKRYEDEGRQIADLPLVHWSCQEAFFNVQQQFEALLQNFPSKILAVILRMVVFPLGKPCRPPSDRLSSQVAVLLLAPSATRDRLTSGTFKGNIVGFIEETFHEVIATEAIENKLQKALRDKTLREQEHSILLQNAVKAGVITAQESKRVLKAEAARYEVITVDDFASEELAHH